MDWKAEPEGIVAVEPGGYVRPIAVGEARVWARHGTDQVAVAVRVTSRESTTRPWEFAADVVPLFTRHDCNTGGCHGKADGQNGFKLSLFGYDPAADYRALTRDAAGRRLDRMDPESSLLIRKATGRTPHGGGLRLAPGSDDYRTLLAWIAAGARKPAARPTVPWPMSASSPAPPASMIPARASFASSPDSPTATSATSPGWPPTASTTIKPLPPTAMVGSL